MPELPEVQTTVNGIKKHTIGHTIVDVWSDYNSSYYKGKGDIRDPKYFLQFKKELIGKKILSVERRAKNILINLSGDKTLLIHMKMTGHVLYGFYEFSPKNKISPSPWLPISPPSLKDPFNRHIHFVITFDNGKNLALSDSRKFAKVTLLDSNSIENSKHLAGIGPEPLEKDFTFKKFICQINKKQNWPIKLTLMDQSVIAGIGNIYADESLWRASIHPNSIIAKIPEKNLNTLYKAIIQTLSHGIDFGGDSMSDYRNILGEKGKFQEKHMAYQRKGEKCQKKSCSGHIIRTVLGGRGTHFCDKHQKLFK